MSCDCIKTVNEALAEHNTRLSLPIIFGDGPDRLMLRTEEVAKIRGKKAVTMFTTFCPFCGVRHEPEGERARTAIARAKGE